MALNAWRHRNFSARAGQTVRVHLGPGQKNYLPGWVNVDANFLTAKIDVWANLADPLPFPDASVDAIYSHHVIEGFAGKTPLGHHATLAMPDQDGAFRIATSPFKFGASIFTARS